MGSILSLDKLNLGQLDLTWQLDLTDPFRIRHIICSLFDPAIFVKVSPLFNFIFSCYSSPATLWWKGGGDLTCLTSDFSIDSIVAKLSPSWPQARWLDLLSFLLLSPSNCQDPPSLTVATSSDKRETGCSPLIFISSMAPLPKWSFKESEGVTSHGFAALTHVNGTSRSNSESRLSLSRIRRETSLDFREGSLFWP